MIGRLVGKGCWCGCVWVFWRMLGRRGWRRCRCRCVSASLIFFREKRFSFERVCRRRRPRLRADDAWTLLGVCRDSFNDWLRWRAPYLRV